ncbi:uromodulin-like 1 [Labrus bergylta]|uniref:uromodulin-like 1 n=1 Tax=Labrus bergylta TaxID=56723 RepID=UPI0033133868
MSWILSMWVAAALLALCMGESTVLEGMSQPVSGFHLCNHNETRNVSFLTIHKVPYTVTKQCGDWLLLKTCTVKLYRMLHQTEYRSVMEEVTRCCDGYEQVGRYCALPVNRSGEFTAKPGICPTADGLDAGSEEACEWDMDCPGWQKCCHRLDHYLCTNPARPANNSESEGRHFNATVTVKADYQQVMSKDGDGHLNHIRLLQAMVTGALQVDVSVYYLGSRPVHPYRTATSLLIECNSTLSLHNVTAALHLLLVYIQEVSSVTVEDINECSHPALHQCSLHANCTNTEGSYHCTCLQGYTDEDPSNPGAHCRDESTTMEPTHSYVPPMNTTYTPASDTTQEPLKSSTVGFVSSTEIIVTADLSMSSVSSSSSHAPQWTSPAPQTTMRSTVESTPPTTTCSPSSVSSVWSAEVTGTSFSVYWSSQSQTNQTFQVVVSRGSDVVHFHGTSDTMMEVQGLKPGVLYNVTVTPCACGSQGGTFSISVKTDAQTLDATARLTNINFTADLQNTSSQAFRNLTESFTDEIYQSLSAEMKAMVDSGLVRIVIKGFSPGSVVVNFTLIVTPSQSQDISNVSAAVLNSLKNSTKYTVDINNTSINDFDECASGENDCSQWATCTNTWASYTCVCLDGFIDQSTERPGRACQVKTTGTTTSVTPTIFSTVSTIPFSQLTTQASVVALTPGTTTPGETTVIKSTSDTDTSTTLVSTTGPVKETAVPVVIHVQVTTAMTVTTPILITTSSTPATTTTPPSTAFLTTETTTPASMPTTPTSKTSTPASMPTTPTSKTSTPAPATTIPASTPTTPAHKTTPAPTMATTARKTTSPATTTTASITTTPMLKTTMTSPTLESTTATPALTTTTAPKTTTPITQTTTPAPTATTSTPKPPTTVATTASSTTTTTPKTTPPLTSTPVMTTQTQIKTTKVPTTTTAHKTTTAPRKPATPHKTSKTVSTTSAIPMASTTSIPKTTIITTTISPAPSTTTNVSILGAISAQCRAAAITVTVAKGFLQSANIRESTLYLGLPECGLNVRNTTHAELTVAWNECATRLVQNETFFTASVTLFNSMDPYVLPSGAVEAPKLRLEVPIVCTYMKSMLISADFGSTGYDMIKDVITGSGVFQVTVQLMNGTIPLPHNYSMSSEEDVVVEVSLNTSSEQIKIVISKCWATPTPNPGDTYSHTFLENSCSLNSFTKVLTNGNSSTSRLSVKIFSIVDLDVIYLHCQVQICVQMGSDTCVPDCLQRAARSSNTIGTALGTFGPILRSDEESLEEEFNTLYVAGLACIGIGVSLIFIIGFVCLFYYQRNRIGHYNFSVKPKQENFTYLVFNT